LLIMPAAKPLPKGFDIWAFHNAVGDWWDYAPGGDSWPCEHKAADWGELAGRVVAVDYAAPALR
jgi:hypothetical protein